MLWRSFTVLFADKIVSIEELTHHLCALTLQIDYDNVAKFSIKQIINKNKSFKNEKNY